MNTRNFREMLEIQWSRGNFVCVGLDSEFSKIPETLKRNRDDIANIIVAFNCAIVEKTKDLVCSYKLNVAFYEAHGEEGFSALFRTIADIKDIAPDVPVILDAKRGDIGNTNAGYVTAAFDILQADAITVNPYLGAEALLPFLEQKEKGIIVLCRTSNPGANEFQDLLVGGKPFYTHVAYRVASAWNRNANCALVVGATYPDELRVVREIAGDMPILIPGIGAQGGDIEKTVTAGKNSASRGMIINSSRGIIFASSGDDFAEVARQKTIELRNQINQYL